MTLIGTDTDLAKAAHSAALVAPSRHARLSAVMLAGDPNNAARFKDDATLEELRAEVMKHLERLAPVLDLEALMAPGYGIANRDVPQGRACNDASAPHE